MAKTYVGDLPIDAKFMAQRLVKKTLSSLIDPMLREIHRLRGKRVVHLLHIGKTGGTAVKHALKPYPATARYVIKRHGHRQTLREIPPGDGVMFFLRDPLNRFVSGFNSRLRRGQPRFFNPWTKDEEAAFTRFDTPNSLALALSSADEEERSGARKAMISIGHVRDSYWKWFDSEDYFLSRLDDMFFIGFQENLLQDFENLKLKLGLPRSVDLPTDDILAHKNPVHFDNTLDSRAVENLTDWYREDIEFFAQCKNYAERVNQVDREFAAVGDQACGVDK